MVVTMAVGQFLPGADKAANLTVIGELVRSASRSGAGLLVLPEYASFATPKLDGENPVLAARRFGVVPAG